MRYEFFPLKVTKNGLLPYSKRTGSFGYYPVDKTSGFPDPEKAVEAVKGKEGADECIIAQLIRTEHGNAGRTRYFYVTPMGQEIEG